MKPALSVFNAIEDDDLHPGALIKIRIDSDPPESFWVSVTRRLADTGEWIGCVDNELVCSDLHGLGYGDWLRFRAAHVKEVYQPNGRTLCRNQADT